MALPCRWGQVMIWGAWFGSRCRKLGIAWRPHPRYGSLKAVHTLFVRWSSRQLRWWGWVHSTALRNAPVSKAFLLWQKCMHKRGQIKWGEEVRLPVAASANCGQDPQWHYTQCGSAVLVMFAAWDSFLADFLLQLRHRSMTMHVWTHLVIYVEANFSLASLHVRQFQPHKRTMRSQYC